MWNEISCVKKQFSNIQLILQLIHLQLCSDFTLTNNFIRILNSNYSFVDVNVDVSYHNSHKFFEKVNNSKLDTNDSKKSMILIFLFLPTSFFYFLIKPEVRIKIIPLAIFFFIILWNTFNLLCLVKTPCEDIVSSRS